LSVVWGCASRIKDLKRLLFVSCLEILLVVVFGFKTDVRVSQAKRLKRLVI
jgi:hypothetical protein